MISKLSDFSLGKRPFLVILGVRVKKSPMMTMQLSCPLQQLSSQLLVCCRVLAFAWLQMGANLFLCESQVTFVFGNFLQCPSRSLTRKTVVATYHVSYKHGMFCLVPYAVMLPGHCDHHCQCSWSPRLPHVLLCGEGFCGLSAHFWDPLVTDACDCRRGYLAKANWMPYCPDVSLYTSCDGSQWKNTSP